MKKSLPLRIKQLIRHEKSTKISGKSEMVVLPEGGKIGGTFVIKHCEVKRFKGSNLKTHLNNVENATLDNKNSKTPSLISEINLGK